VERKKKLPNSRGIQGSVTVSQAQQLSDAGIKGAQPLKTTLPNQPKQEEHKGPSDAQRKAQAAAQAASKQTGRGGGKTKGRGGKK